MIISPLFRTALCAAIVASVSLPAAANGDAVFSTAFGTLNGPLAKMALIKAQSQTPPASTPSESDYWRRAFWIVQDKGECFFDKDPLVTCTLEDVFGDPQGAYVTRRITVNGRVNADRELQLIDGIILYSNTRTDEKTQLRHRDIATFNIDSAGKFTGGRFNSINLTPNGEVPGVSDTWDNSNITAKNLFSINLKYWGTRKI